MKLNAQVINEISFLLPLAWSSTGQLDLDKLAHKLNAEVTMCEFKDPEIDGAVYKFSTDSESYGFTYRIALKRSLPLARLRFTYAHELGHIISDKADSHSKTEFEKKDLIKDKESTLFRGLDKSPSEVEANEIAAQLLMPALILKQYLSAGLTRDEIANTLGVSKQALEIRLNNLGLV